MISNPMKCLGTLALLLPLALVVSCAPVQKVAPDPVALTSGPFEKSRIKLLIRGIDPDAAMATEARLITTLDTYGVSRPPGSLKSWINKIRHANGGTGATLLAGLGGIPARTLLTVARATLDANGDFVDRPGVETYGQIETECLGQPGYAFDSATGNGHLCVTVFTTTTLGASGQTHTVAERFMVEVTGGFDADDKNPIDADNVFPIAATATGLNVNSATATGFNYKLWASGNTIRVTHVWRNQNYDTNPNNFTALSASNPNFATLFDLDPEACIDMMFAAPPPATLPADATAGSFYCLGRCANPPIINTR